MDYLPTMPDKFAELAIVDPPYGIGASNKSFIRQGKQTGKSKAISGLNYTAKEWDNAPSMSYFNELFRVSLEQVIWGGNYFGLRGTSCYVVWDKDNGDNLYADCELAWASFDSAVRKIKYKWHGMLQEHMRDKKEIQIHPTQKPVALYRWLLHNYANPGDLILDTHVGSASSLIACEQMGFQYIGIEKDKDYYDAACGRIEKAREKMKQEEIFSRAEIEVKQESLFESQ